MSTDFHRARSGSARAAGVARAAGSGGEHTAAAIATWLLEGGAQQSHGCERGAVAGWVATDGSVEYLYPEITGYFLHWLATTAVDRSAATLAHRAALAQEWLGSWLSRGAWPPTRIYVRGAGDDWRNRALFFFDLAMVLRGLGLAASRGLIVVDPAVVARLCAHLESLIAGDGCFDACRSAAGAALPDRWSTRRGGFLAKAAAAIIVAAGPLDLPERLRQSAEASFRASVQAAVQEPHDEAHPFLYAFEGVLALLDRPEARFALPIMAAQLRRRVDAATQRGSLRESKSHTGVARLDIIAQCIRVALLLHTVEPSLAPSRDQVDSMLCRLASEVRADGSLPFCAEDAGAVQCNTWTAMFSEQAFSLAHGIGETRLHGNPLLI